MKKFTVGFALFASLFLAACGGSESSGSDSSSSQEMDPETIYMGKCSSCHGGDLSGASAPALNQIGASKSYDEILGVINNGQGRMPGGMIEGEQAEAVAEWLSEMK